MAALATRPLSSLLVGVGAVDPLVYATVSAAVLAVSLLASVVPALYRARRIDPAISLRGE